MRGLNQGLSNAVEGITGLSLSSFTGAAAIGALAAGAKKAIGDASDLAETTSKVGVVFGESAQSVRDFGKTAASSLGMSEQAALSAAATYGNLFVSMGMTTDKAADMSTGLVQLAGDLASFNNMDTGEVLEKLRAGLTGETEPLKSLGVNLSAAAVEAKALSMGLVENKSQLDASAKAQATYALILEQTKTAQGDFARTSEGMANQQRILDAQMQDLSATIGGELLPVANDWIKVLVNAAKTTSLLVSASESLDNALESHGNEVAKTSKNYEEYQAEMVRAIETTGQIVQITDDGVRVLERHGTRIVDVTDKYNVLTEAEYENARAVEGWSSATREAMVATKDYTYDAAAAAEEAAAKTEQSMGAWADRYKALGEAAKAAAQVIIDANFERLGEIVGGGFGKEVDDFNKKMGDLQTKSRDVNKTIKDLEGRKYLTAEQKSDLEAAREEYAQTGQAMTELADEHEEAMHRMAFNMLMERAASDGLTENEVSNLTEIGQAWGLYDQKTADVIDAVNGNIGMLDTNTPDLFLSIIQGILNVPSSKSFTIDVDVNGLDDLRDLINMYGEIGMNAPPGSGGGSGGDNGGRDLPGMNAIGGNVWGGQAVIVGERGPELFVPASDGAIVPNDETQQMVGGGGSTSIVLENVYITTPDPGDFLRQLGELASAALNGGMALAGDF